MLVATLTWAAGARAQTLDVRPPTGSIALEPFQPTPPGDVFSGVPGPFIGGHLVFRASLTLDHADQPLVGTMDGAKSAVLSHQTFLHTGVSMAFADRALVSLSMPVAVSQSGDDPEVGKVVLLSPKGAEAGDLRLGLRFRVAGGERDPAQLAVGFYLHVPTGAAQSYVSDQSVRLQPQLSFGGRGSVLVWGLTLGGDVRGNGNPSAMTGGFGLGLSFLGDSLRITSEVTASMLVQSGAFRLTDQRYLPRDLFHTNAELLFGAAVRPLRWPPFNGLFFGLSAGPGLTDAIGTPAYRVTGTIGWSPAGSAAPDPDPDRDGISGAEDACPFTTGIQSALPERHGCPFQDRDGDAIDDRDDACKDRAGIASKDPKKNGCPSDRDGDGVWDDVDVCKEVAGVAAMNGCPADADRDGIPDVEDACPGEQGEKVEDATTNGCPAPAAPEPPAAPAPVEPAEKGTSVSGAPAQP